MTTGGKAIAAIVSCALAASAAAAQMIGVPPIDRIADEAAFRSVDRRVHDDQGPAARGSREALEASTAMIAMGDALRRSKPDPVAANAVLRRYVAAVQADAKLMQDPTYGDVPPGTRRMFVVTPRVALSAPIPPAAGEPYHIVPIESAYPVLTIPAIQAVLSTKGRFSVVGVLGYTDSISKRRRLDIDHMGSPVTHRVELDRILPGAARDLDAWNRTVAPVAPEEARNDLALAEAARAEGRQYNATHPVSDVDAFSVLAPSVVAEARTFGPDGRNMVVTVVNGGRSIYRFAPQDHAYETTRHLAPLLADPFADGPPAMNRAAACVASTLPTDTGPDMFGHAQNTGSSSPYDPTVAPRAAMAPTATDARIQKRTTGKLLGAIVSQGGLVNPQLSAAGALTDAYSAVTGKDYFTGDAKDRSGGLVNVARRIGLKALLGRNMPETKETLNKVADAKSVMDDAREPPAPEEIADERQSAREHGAHDDAETARLAGQTLQARLQIEGSAAATVAGWQRSLDQCKARGAL